MHYLDIGSLDDLIEYLTDNGLSEEEANHLIHKKFVDLEYKTPMQLINYGEWEMLRSFAYRYMLGENLI